MLVPCASGGLAPPPQRRQGLNFVSVETVFVIRKLRASRGWNRPPSPAQSLSPSPLRRCASCPTLMHAIDLMYQCQPGFGGDGTA